MATFSRRFFFWRAAPRARSRLKLVIRPDIAWGDATRDGGRFSVYTRRSVSSSGLSHTRRAILSPAAKSRPLQIPTRREFPPATISHRPSQNPTRNRISPPATRYHPQQNTIRFLNSAKKRNLTRLEISPATKYHTSQNPTRNEVSPVSKFHPQQDITRNEIPRVLKFHLPRKTQPQQNITRNKITPATKYHPC